MHQQNILLKFELLDGKFEAICITMFIIKIVVSQVIEEKIAMDHSMGSPHSKGTQVNPIYDVDEDPHTSGRT